MRITDITDITNITGRIHSVGAVPFRDDLSANFNSRTDLTVVDSLGGGDAEVLGREVGIVAPSAYLDFDSLTGIGIADFEGDAVPMKSTNRINLDGSKLSNLKLTDGSVFYFNGHLYNSTGAEIKNHQGLVWDSLSDTYSRIGTTANIPISQSAGSANLPIQSLMRRCLLLDNGTVNYYLDPNNSALKIDGITASDLTGVDGQVMVQVPKFYYRQEFATKYRYWSISLEQLEGYTVHPAFVKDGVEVDFRYYSAFKGSMWRASTGAMTAAADIPTSLYVAGDKMCSVAGNWAKVNETRPEYRVMAAERGPGWIQLDYYLNSAVQLLFLVEYANFNTQTMIGMGRTTLSGGAWAADSYLGKTGRSIADGNNTNSVSIGGVDGYLTDYMTYRGIEDWYGGEYTMLDGLAWDGRWTGVEAAQPIYATGNSAYFNDESGVGMEHLCDASYIGMVAGYISNFENAVGFIPSEALGSSTTKATDYYYQYSQVGRNYWRVPLFGSNASSGVTAGGFLLDASSAWSNALAAIAGRLCY